MSFCVAILGRSAVDLGRAAEDFVAPIRRPVAVRLCSSALAFPAPANPIITAATMLNFMESPTSEGCGWIFESARIQVILQMVDAGHRHGTRGLTAETVHCSDHSFG